MLYQTHGILTFVVDLFLGDGYYSSTVACKQLRTVPLHHASVRATRWLSAPRAAAFRSTKNRDRCRSSSFPNPLLLLVLLVLLVRCTTYSSASRQAVLESVKLKLHCCRTRHHKIHGSLSEFSLTISCGDGQQYYEIQPGIIRVPLRTCTTRGLVWQRTHGDNTSTEKLTRRRDGTAEWGKVVQTLPHHHDDFLHDNPTYIPGTYDTIRYEYVHLSPDVHEVARRRGRNTNLSSP